MKRIVYQVTVIRSETVEVPDDFAGPYTLPESCYTPEGWERDGVRVTDADTEEEEIAEW